MTKQAADVKRYLPWHFVVGDRRVRSCSEAPRRRNFVRRYKSSQSLFVGCRARKKNSVRKISADAADELTLIEKE